MPPQGDESWVLFESDLSNGNIPKVTPSAKDRKYEILWTNVILYVYFHIAAVYGAYLFLADSLWATKIFAVLLYFFNGLGITAGVHRYWSHKAFKAKLPLRLMLIFFNSISHQNSVLNWARDHRTHHKYSETDADPHNASRGFLFSHVGWLMVKKHPEIKAKGQKIDVKDLLDDPLVVFQDRYYNIVMPICCFILPTIVPTMWGESLWTAYHVCAIFRWVFVLNVTWLVNSAAHMFGNKPYDMNIKPAELKSLSLFVLGEGFHNYHHTFPWDYRSTELGGYLLNFTNLFLDAMIAIGWAYDLKTVDAEAVRRRVKRTGDGTHHLWGWDDADITKEDREITSIVNPEKSI